MIRRLRRLPQIILGIEGYKEIQWDADERGCTPVKRGQEGFTPVKQHTREV